MSFSGFYGNYVSFNWSFFSLFVNDRHCFLRWLSIYFSVLCVKSSTLSSIYSIHDLLQDSRILSFNTSSIKLHPVVVPTTPHSLILLLSISRFWFWGCWFLAWLVLWMSRRIPVRWLSTGISWLQLLPPYIKIIFFRGEICKSSWWMLWYWPIHSSFSLSMHGLASPSLCWWFSPEVPWRSCLRSSLLVDVVVLTFRSVFLLY